MREDPRLVRPLFVRAAEAAPRPLFTGGAAGAPRPRSLFQGRIAGPEAPRAEDGDRRGGRRGPGRRAAESQDPDLDLDLSAEEELVDGPPVVAREPGGRAARAEGEVPPWEQDLRSESEARSASEAAATMSAALEAERAQLALDRGAQTALRQRYERSLETLAEALAADHRHLEGELVDLAIEVARELLQRELRMDREQVVRLATAALQVVAEDVAATLMVAPQDQELIEAARERLSSGRTGLLRVVADPTLAPGECVAQAGTTRVDGRLQDRLERVRRALHGVATEAA